MRHRSSQAFARSSSPCRAAIVLLAASAALLTGCDSYGLQRAAVSGSVNLDGKPLETGVIRFVPSGDTKGPVAQATVHEGQYSLARDHGPVVGQHRIEIEAIDHFGFELDDEAAYAQHMKTKRRRLPPNPVPKQYNRDSKLSRQVTSTEDQQFDFELDTKKK